MSQEDLAVLLHVVRQTISKWENAISIPDADQLILLAEVLDISVNDLLGIETDIPNEQTDVESELTKAREHIARLEEETRLNRKVGQIRGLMLCMSFIAIIVMHTIKNEVVVSFSILGI